ncbi:MAG: single-stranded DNA-binding protein [Candidatus Pacebacteria bacterium]|nr:single-stranded DNA-binding protein [Candidatus Paceibacterota bacterium]
MNLNKVILIGRVTKDPEIRSTSGGTATSRIGLATNRIYKNKAGEKKELVQFHNCVAFGRTAEIVSQYIKKGQLIMVEGRIETRSWENRNKERSYITEIIVEGLQMGPRAAGIPGGANDQEEAPKDVQDGQNSPQGEDGAGEDIPVIEDGAGIDIKDIPF